MFQGGTWGVLRLRELIKQLFDGTWNYWFLKYVPKIDKNVYNLGRHGSPRADTQSARSYGDYHAF